MRFLINFHIYLLFACGIILCLAGILTMLGMSQIISGIFPTMHSNQIRLGAISLISIASGGRTFIEGLLVSSFSLTMWMVMKITFRPARMLKPSSPTSSPVM